MTGQEKIIVLALILAGVLLAAWLGEESLADRILTGGFALLAGYAAGAARPANGTAPVVTSVKPSGGE